MRNRTRWIDAVGVGIGLLSIGGCGPGNLPRPVSTASTAPTKPAETLPVTIPSESAAPVAVAPSTNPELPNAQPHALGELFRKVLVACEGNPACDNNMGGEATAEGKAADAFCTRARIDASAMFDTTGIRIPKTASHQLLSTELSGIVQLGTMSQSGPAVGCLSIGGETQYAIWVEQATTAKNSGETRMTKQPFGDNCRTRTGAGGAIGIGLELICIPTSTDTNSLAFDLVETGSSNVSASDLQKQYDLFNTELN